MSEAHSSLPPVTGHGDGATVSLIDYLDAIRAGDVALQEERDRRYAEVGAEKEKAARIKENADRAALELARSIQEYKDAKANELREQLASERGQYVTRAELAGAVRELQALITPLRDYVSADAGRNAGAGGYRTERRLDTSQVIAALAVIAAIVTAILYAVKK